MGKQVVKTYLRPGGFLALVIAAGHVLPGVAVAQAPPQTEQPAKPTYPPAGSSGAQKASPAVSATLEEMLAKALKDNPDIRVAEAKVREAEAELNRIRLQVVQKVVTLHHALEAQKSAIEAVAAQLERAAELKARGAAPAAEVARLQSVSISEKAKLAAIEAEVPYLLGRPPSGTTQRALQDYLSGQSDASRQTYSQRLASALEAYGKLSAAPVSSAMSDCIRKALDTPATLSVQDTPLTTVVRDLFQQAHGIPVVFLQVGDLKVNLQFKQPMPLGLLVQVLEDSFLGLSFGMRDYGIVVAYGSSLPEGAVRLYQFWKSKLDQDKKKPPSKKVQGKVKAIDAQSGLVVISVGRTAGVQVGDTLEVYRLDPQPKYLGTMQIVNTTSEEAVGKMVRRQPSDLVQVIDLVGSKVDGR